MEDSKGLTHSEKSLGEMDLLLLGVHNGPVTLQYRLDGLHSTAADRILVVERESLWSVGR
jgi:hypothetical protein